MPEPPWVVIEQRVTDGIIPPWFSANHYVQTLGVCGEGQWHFYCLVAGGTPSPGHATGYVVLLQPSTAPRGLWRSREVFAVCTGCESCDTVTNQKNPPLSSQSN